MNCFKTKITWTITRGDSMISAIHVNIKVKPFHSLSKVPTCYQILVDHWSKKFVEYWNHFNNHQFVHTSTPFGPLTPLIVHPWSRCGLSVVPWWSARTVCWIIDKQYYVAIVKHYCENCEGYDDLDFISPYHFTNFYHMLCQKRCQNVVEIGWV